MTHHALISTTFMLDALLRRNTRNNVRNFQIGPLEVPPVNFPRCLSDFLSRDAARGTSPSRRPTDAGRPCGTWQHAMFRHSLPDLARVASGARLVALQVAKLAEAGQFRSVPVRWEQGLRPPPAGAAAGWVDGFCRYPG